MPTFSEFTDEERFLLERYDPAIEQAKLADRLENLVIVARSDFVTSAAGTPSAETAGPPDFIDVTLQLSDAEGNPIAERANVRVRIFDDADFTTPSTVGTHRLTHDGSSVIIGGDDSIDAVYRTEADGSVVVRVEDVAGASGISIYGQVVDGGNEEMRVRGTSFQVTFN
jgi:hypothetical protein